ncbi:MAG: protoheme IX farnesyltransferase [Alphaproteobacteria bacterium]|nr:protoheme IX farnesyltransferase [Alphaproteobacteria bacterium]
MTAAPSVGALEAAPSVGDFWALLKPRVMSLVVFTALVGMAVAPEAPHPVLGFVALLCIAVGAGAAGALNQWYEAAGDGLMERTRDRPIPAGRMEPDTALAFGAILAVGSVAVMGLLVGPAPAALLAFTIAFYVGVYTVWLKRRTPQNIVIGGLAGALPPAIGWAAAGGGLAIEPALLVALIFVWTPPHFWALALTRGEDYARAGIPMLPVVAGAAETARQIRIYSLVLAPLGVAPGAIGLGGSIYLAVSAVLGAAFVALALRLGDGSDQRRALQMFGFSILYLFLLFAVLLGERLLGLGAAA